MNDTSKTSTDSYKDVVGSSYPSIIGMTLLVTFVTWHIFKTHESTYGLIPIGIYGFVYLCVAIWAGANRKLYYIVVFSVLSVYVCGSFLWLQNYKHYIIFALFAVFSTHVLGAILALLLVRIFHLFKSDEKSFSPFQIVIAVLVVGFVVYAYSNHANTKFSKEEAIKRNKFIKRIARAIVQDELEDYTVKSVLSLKTGNLAYKTNGTSIFHGYDGEIDIEHLDDQVIITYHDIPSGTACVKMHSYQPFASTGFKTTLINNESMEKGSGLPPSRHAEIFCEDINSPVTLTYKGKLEDILDRR